MRAYKIEPMKQFPIVGIGASAGGPAAFEAFFSGMPAFTEPNMASVRNVAKELYPEFAQEPGIVAEPES